MDFDAETLLLIERILEVPDDDPREMVRIIGLTPEEIEHFMVEYAYQDDPEYLVLLQASRELHGGHDPTSE